MSRNSPTRPGFLRRKNIRDYAERLIEQYDVRSGQGPVTIARSMSGGNQQKAIVAREIDKDPELLVAVQPTRGLDVGAIEYIHRQLVAQRDEGKAVLLVSLELDEVMDVPDRILVMYEGEIVGELDPENHHPGGAGPLHGRRQERRGEGMKKNTFQEQRRPIAAGLSFVHRAGSVPRLSRAADHQSRWRRRGHPYRGQKLPDL